MGWNVVIYEQLYDQMNIFYCYLLVTNIDFIVGLTCIHYIAFGLIIGTTAIYATKTCIVSVLLMVTPCVVTPFCLPDKCNG
jgi:hypothetical protein